MQAVLATSLRSGVGTRFGNLTITRSSFLLSSAQLSTSRCFTTRHQQPSILSTSSHYRRTTQRCSSNTTRSSLIRASSSHSQASSPCPSTASSTTTSASAVPSPTEHESSSNRVAPLQSESSTMNGANTTSPRVKRKSSPFDAIESGRPPKHHRPSLNGRQSAGDNTPDVEVADLDMHEDFIDEAALQALPAVGPDSFEWQATIENVVRNVVSIRFCQTCSFDTDPALNSEATGFVVDAERGYILTNRHVVGAGPFWGYCIFDNHEEVDAYPVYRDPVHDFGILKFDPKAIKYMPVKALTLRPDLAKGKAENSSYSSETPPPP